MWDALALERGCPLISDREVALLLRGDPAAFEDLLSRHQNRLYRYLLRLVREPQAAEDVFQQTWVQVMTNLDRYDRSRSFESWLFAIAHNLAIDYLRRRSKEVLEEPLPSGDTGTARLPSREPGALESLLAKERRGFLADKLSELPVIYREAISLRFEEEMTFEEIAEVTRTPVSTAKSRVQRALSSLRQKLGLHETGVGD